MKSVLEIVAEFVIQHTGERTTLHVRDCPCVLYERAPEVVIPFTSVARLPFTTAFVVTRTQAGPTCQMGTVTELRHVGAQLGE